jgi:hypothetical protein
MNGVVRGFALAIALATSVPCAQVAWAQDPLIFEYHGWRIDLTGARGREADAKMIDTEGEIEVDGLVLMARPKSWTDKAKVMDTARAFERVAIKERQ